MKGILTILVAWFIAITANAQDNTGILPRWCIELNVLGGNVQQQLGHTDLAAGYPMALNSTIGSLQSKGIYTAGGHFGAGFFFGPSHHLGIGAGIVYLQQRSDISLDPFHIEYRSLDHNNDTFRQLITSDGGLKEQITTTSFNIPLTLKWQTNLSKRLDLAIDAGIMYNRSVTSSVTVNANALFDYEAIYKFGQTNDGGKPVYDNSPIPDPRDWMMTSAQYNEDQLNAFRSRGYNVGIGMAANRDGGTVSYRTGSVGWLLRPALNYRISKHVSLQVGAYVMGQSFMRSADFNKVTDKMGEYNLLAGAVSRSDNTSYGATIGARYLLFKAKARDRDGDGVPDKHDRCPHDAGKINGCPDSDKDGVADIDDSCRNIPGLARLHGCPERRIDAVTGKMDTDGDGTIDEFDDCINIAGPVSTHGCPDADNDGTPDKYDDCPNDAGPIVTHGCLDSDGDGVADKFDDCLGVVGSKRNHGCPLDTMTTQQADGSYLASHIVLEKSIINFGLGGSVLENTAYTILDEAVAALNKDVETVIFVCGFTDDIGTDVSNLVLSVARAEAVNKYLLSKGLPQERIIISGYGKKAPLVENTSPENRAKNRRTEMRLLLPIK